jgi:hypothetical protein
MSDAGAYALPDRFWIDAATCIEPLMRPGDLLLAPPEFLEAFPGTIALHVRKRMLADVVITHYILHKAMLAWVDPVFLLEAAQAIPVFANEVFVVFSWRGERLPDDQTDHLSPFNEFLASIQGKQSVTYNTAVVVTTYSRPWALRRTLASLTRQRRPVVVVDDGSSFLHRLRNGFTARTYHTTYVRHPVNLGISNSINIGVSHWLAHPEIEWISVFNDDIEVVDGMFDILDEVLRQTPNFRRDSLYTGYLNKPHPTSKRVSIAGRPALLARSCSAKHLHAHRSYWQSVLPIPTTYLGAPKRTGGLFPGQGSDADWWIASWAPRAALKRGGYVVIIPNLVSTFAHDAASSTWGNEN